MTTAARTAPGSLRTLLEGVLDYAGLFPPAGLGMATAVAEYVQARRGEHAWMLGRFVLPVARLAEWEAAVLSHRLPAGQSWRLSVLSGGRLSAELTDIQAFNRRHQGQARMDSIEVKASSAREVEAAMQLLTPEMEAYFEIPLEPDPAPLVEAIAAHGGRAKVRTGGLTAEAFPSPESLARFLERCAAAEVPFKATAGLHHPLRGEYLLSEEPGSPRGTMFGFLNVFLAAALLRAGRSASEVLSLLVESSPEALQWGEEEVAWSGHRLGLEVLRETRQGCALSFGSCSFREPIDDLHRMGLLG